MKDVFSKLGRLIKEKRLMKTINEQLIKKATISVAYTFSYLTDKTLRDAYREYVRLIEEENDYLPDDNELHEEVAREVVDNYILARETEVADIYQPGVMWRNILNEVKVYSDWQRTSDNKVLTDALRKFYRTDLILAFAGDIYIWAYKSKKFNKKLQVYMIVKRFNELIRQRIHFDQRLISTTDIGKNIYVNYKGRKLSFKIMRDAHYLNRILELNLLPTENPVIGELGSGAGELAILAKKVLPDCTYVCFDLPTTLLVASYNVKMTFPDLKIGLYEDFKYLNKITKEDIERFDVVLLPNWCIEFVDEGTCDLFINIGSLSEMDYQIIENYVERIEKITHGYFYTINRNIKVGEFGAEDIPLDEFPFSENTKVIHKGYDSASDLYHGHYGSGYRTNYWELVLKCRK